VNAKLRLACVTAALLLPACLLAAWVGAGSLESDPLPAASLPRQLGPWVATEDRRLDEASLEIVAPDAHLLRLYEAPGRSPVWIYLGLYASRGSYKKAAHDPEVCYPAQGWEVVGSRSVSIDLDGADPQILRAKLLDAHHGLDREAVLYWFQPAGRWPAVGAVEEILRVGDAVNGTSQYAFVRLSTPYGDDASAAHDLLEFARLLAPSVRARVDSLSAPPRGS
jgi:EpsI family protein